jgi:hypothetical protein
LIEIDERGRVAATDEIQVEEVEVELLLTGISKLYG